MTVSNDFQPKIIAYVCNWCTYLGADLAGTNRLEYPANVRIVRLPCTGRIDFNLIVKAFEMGADAVLVSGCHPGDCHYTAGNYHARRRWILFRQLLETLGSISGGSIFPGFPPPKARSGSKSLARSPTKPGNLDRTRITGEICQADW